MEPQQPLAQVISNIYNHWRTAVAQEDPTKVEAQTEVTVADVKACLRVLQQARQICSKGRHYDAEAFKYLGLAASKIQKMAETVEVHKPAY